MISDLAVTLPVTIPDQYLHRRQFQVTNFTFAISRQPIGDPHWQNSCRFALQPSLSHSTTSTVPNHHRRYPTLPSSRPAGMYFDFSLLTLLQDSDFSICSHFTNFAPGESISVSVISIVFVSYAFHTCKLSIVVDFTNLDPENLNHQSTAIPVTCPFAELKLSSKLDTLSSSEFCNPVHISLLRDLELINICNGSIHLFGMEFSSSQFAT